MRLISWDWFWYVLLGFILGGGAAYLHAYLKVKSSSLKWSEMLITVVVFVSTLFMGQTIIGSYYEGEFRAAWLTLIVMGLPIILLCIWVVRMYQKRVTAA